MKDYMQIINIAKALNLTAADLKRAYDAWVAADSSVPQTPAAVEVAPEPNPAPQQRPNYKPDEITAAIDRNSDLKTLYKHAQTLLGKTLNTTEIQILYSLYDFYNFPVEVAMEMLTYAAKIDKRNMRYIEQIAINWAEKGILTHEDAESYAKKMQQRARRESKITQALGIDRKLTQSEEQFISAWANQLKVPLELVPIAYERMVNGTGGKFSLAYMNKIFENWAAAGIKTAEQLAAHEAEYKSSRQPQNSGVATAAGSVKPSKFNNFTGTSGVDYSAAAKAKTNL